MDKNLRSLERLQDQNPLKLKLLQRRLGQGVYIQETPRPIQVFNSTELLIDISKDENGDGLQYEYGEGYGFGADSGIGSGDGVGHGTGYRSGYGYGYGFGDGFGYIGGIGYGTEFGSKYGWGSGSGYGTLLGGSWLQKGEI